MKNQQILNKVDRYYSEKIQDHGPVASGVDWNSKESQYLRFEQLSKVYEAVVGDEFSVIDFGCGYGEYINYLNQNDFNFKYFGIDISEKMLEVANSRFSGDDISFHQNLESIDRKDFIVASGVFNVRNDLSDSEWKDYIESNLEAFYKYSEKGFSFNMLTSYSDKPFMKDYLYYADPLYFFDFCKKHFSNNVALLHDYNLYEFTLIIRK